MLKKVIKSQKKNIKKKITEILKNNDKNKWVEVRLTIKPTLRFWAQTLKPIKLDIDTN